MTPQELLRLMGERQTAPSAPTPEDIARFLALSAGLTAPAPNVHAQPQYAPPGTTLAAGNPAQQVPLGATGYGYRQGPAAFHYDVQEPGVEAPHPLLDPVDLAAGALTPAGLRAFRALGQKLDDPLPMAALRSGRAGVLRSEKGNLGPPPVDAQGRPLPESVLRDEQGQLQRFYHGTTRVFDDFSLAKVRSGAGGDLYGPGVYMTENPSAANAYANPKLSGVMSSKDSKPFHVVTTYDEAKAFVGRITKANSPYEEYYPIVISRLPNGQFGIFKTLPLRENIRPVYPDLKKPFNIDAPADKALVEHAVRSGFGSDIPLTRQGRIDWEQLPTNKEVYHALTVHLGDKAEVNDWLQANGYDGILHIARNFPKGMKHQVAIAFSPDDVYPAPNVESLLQLLRTKEP